MIDKRDEIFDFIKGILVIGMVVYHSLNYFTTGYSVIYDYFSFVARGFILLSGFMCGAIYYSKFQKDRYYVLKRLPIRAFKLISIFLIINISIGMLAGRMGSGNSDAANSILAWTRITLLEGAPYLSSFEILVPIAYVLLISPLFFHKTGFGINLIYVIIFSYMAFSLFDIDLSYNLNCLLIGIGGISIGLVYTRINKYLDNIYLRSGLAVFLTIIYVILIPMGFDIRQNILITFVYICIVIFNLYSLGRLLNLKKCFSSKIIIIGRYSLFLYIGQIVILHILRSMINTRFSVNDLGLWIIIVSVNIAMVIAATFTEFLRSNSKIMDKAYRLIFA
jgi:hypothetical protein